MAYPGDANAGLHFDLFHLLRSEHPNENILFSPLNISTALHLLYSCRGDYAQQAEMPSDFSQNNQDLHSGSRPVLEESPNHNALEASQRWDFMHKQKAQEALPKSLKEDCEVCETKEKPPIASPLPAFKKDARQDGSNLTHALPTSTGHSIGNESVSSQYLLWRKLIPNSRAVEDVIREEAPTEMEASKKLTSGPENQKGSITQKNMAVEDVKLPYFYSVQRAARSRPSASFQPPKYTAYEGIYNNAKTKLGTSSRAFLPTSELDNRQLITGRPFVKTTLGTPLMFYTKDVSLLGTGNDNAPLSQEQPSLEGTIEPQQGSPLGSLEKLSKIENIAPPDEFSISPVSSMETVAGTMQRSEVQESSRHMDSMGSEDSETESSPPFTTASYDMNDVPWCSTSAQTPEDTINQKTNEDPSGVEGTSNQIASSNAWSTDRLSSSTGDQRVAYSLNQPISMSRSFSYDLPWHKYLRGREQRDTVVQFFYFLRQNEFQNIMAPLESRRYKRQA